MDAIDHQIISLLSGNPRMSAAEIGRSVHRSRVAVSRRIDLLIASGEIVGFSIETKKKSCPVLFEVKMKVNGRCESVVPSFRREYPIVKAWSVAGASDLFVWVEAETSQEVHEMRNVLLSIPDVSMVSSHVVIRTIW